MKKGSFARDDVVWETSIIDQFRGDAGISHTDNVGIAVHVQAESGGGALELALDTRENFSHAGGGGGDGERLVTVDVVGSIEWRDRGRDIVFVHLCVPNRLRENGAPRRVDDVGNRIVDVVVVGVDFHAVMQD